MSCEAAAHQYGDEMKVFALIVLALSTAIASADERSQLELDMIRAQQRAAKAFANSVMENQRDSYIKHYQARVDDSLRCRPLQNKFADVAKRYPSSLSGSFMTEMQNIMKEVERAQCVYGKAPSEEERAKLHEEKRQYEAKKQAFQRQSTKTEAKNSHLSALKKNCESAHALNREQPSREHILAADEACTKYENAQEKIGSEVGSGSAEFTLR